jgi:hypothetical protein
MGMSVGEFFELNQNIVLTPEEAGVGFAISIVFAERFKGMEISSIQASKAADIHFREVSSTQGGARLSAERKEHAAELCERVRLTLQGQAADWKKRSLFERQWVIRDFRKTAGMSVDEWLESLRTLEQSLQDESELNLPPLSKLAAYYSHLAELAKGYEKDATKLEESLRHVYSWRDEVEQLIKSLES